MSVCTFFLLKTPRLESREGEGVVMAEFVKTRKQQTHRLIYGEDGNAQPSGASEM
jgi:hypothetical protein